MINFDFSDYIIKYTSSGTYLGECSCRAAAYWAQCGLCYITGRPLEKGYREMHHRDRRYYGGKDTAENTVLVNKGIHRLIHSTDPVEIRRLVEQLSITKEQMFRINGIRREAHMKVIRAVTITLAA